jgi:hypothetical protein
MGLDWGVQFARLSLFLSEPYAISDKDWAVVTGQGEAETRQAVAGGKRLSGSVPGGIMHMSTISSRFDMVLAAADNIQEGDEIQLPSVGPYDETFTSFFESTCKWIEQVNPPTIRVAFGAALTCKAASREEAYGHLRDLLKSLKVDPKNMRDLEYRVNWPGKSKVEQDLIVNRITTWNSVRIIRQLVQISETRVGGGNAGHVDAVRVELDHNTDEAKKAVFDQGTLIPIYSELVDLARQNAAEGEVPCG